MSTSVLATDGYKFSMAEAGWPLREEVFYYSHRRGGPQVLPVDVTDWLRALRPENSPDASAYLARHQYEPGAGTWAALGKWDALSVQALPKGAVFLPGEPVFSLKGPSALVSWLEPLVLQLHFRIQVATLARFDRPGLERALAVVTCEKERELALETLEGIGEAPLPIRVDSDGYRARVANHARALVGVVGDPGRIFEVGLRAASCIEQHLIALEACRAEGISRTSHVLGSERLGMVPVGTMGHEHVQRYGDDLSAFRAMRERRPARSSYLLDTYDTLRSGVPAAFRLIAEAPERGDSIRYDSGDEPALYRATTSQARARGLRPVQIFEDGLGVEETERLEALRRELGWREDEQFYGYGGFLVCKPSPVPLSRDRVAAVYKLSQTGDAPTMKFGAEGAGKQSVPGRPVVLRRVRGEGPAGWIAQEGEAVPEGYLRLTGSEDPVPLEGGDLRVVPTAATRELVDRIARRREEAIASWV